MASFAAKFATYADLLALPDELVGEILNGTLHTSPRPRLRHAQTSSVLGEELGPPFRRGQGGPGGWLFLDEPEIHLGRNVLVPDLAGWTLDRLPEVPDEPYLTIAPDWLCEVISPSTEQLDREHKLPIYAAHGVGHMWLVDPLKKSLEVYRLDGRVFRLYSQHVGDEAIRAEPFAAFALQLGRLWGG